MTTPSRQQYLSVKRQYPDAIVFYRLGDFYETFDDDAKLMAKELDIVLTSRKVSKKQRVPMAGIPHHSAENYIARLIKLGYKVAICEQIGSTPINGLVPREVQRVITPGTVVEGSLLADNENNYLAALIVTDNKAGIAFADITTGQFGATQLQNRDIDRLILNEITRLKPAEVLIPHDKSADLFRSLKIPHSLYDSWRFDLDQARQELQRHFDVATLDGFGLAGKPLAIQAAGAIIQYVAETQKAALNHITHLTAYSTDNFMDLDASTRRNLELTETIRRGSVQGSLLDVLDKTITAMGGRLLRTWLHQPLLDVAALNSRLDDVERFTTQTLARGDIRTYLKEVADLERLTNRVSQGIATPRDLQAIQRSLEVVPQLQMVLTGLFGDAEGEAKAEADAKTDPNLDTPIPNPHLPISNLQSPSPILYSPFSILHSLAPCQDIVNLIDQAIADEPPATLSKVGIIRSGFSAELDSIIAGSRDAKVWVANLEGVERERTGIKSLKVGFNKVFGYYLEVTRANADQVPPEYIRKQTLVNAERYITPELKEYENLILNADERQLEVEVRIFKEVCAQIAASAQRLLTTARTLAYLDVVTALAEVALHNNYVRPALSDDAPLEIINGRHPVVETMPLVDADGLATAFVPNDIRMSSEELIHIITGPNMSGKSTFLRQVALIVLMAQIGSFVPADRAHIGLVDRIFTRIGAQDEIHAGQSTFMVEMVETAAILSQSTGRSLLILDEVGRGTSTYDGLAIARAVVEYIHNNPKIRAKTLFATHYHELTEVAKYLPHLRNYNVAVAEEGSKVIFLHKIVPGGADRSYGIHVAQIAGIPKAVIDRANEILEELEGNADFQERRERTRQTFSGVQMSFLAPEVHPLVEEIKEIDVDSLSPLEALNKLYELKQRATE
ncbi:MAG: DNA mismatch repair protein MutS [Anaerolineae bacterium]|nr:DNA mismatch repair protein MutS [Anaerolineae bacterium]